MTAPDGIYPSTNEFGIPDLLPSLQADCLDLLVEQWGRRSRKNTQHGTYHFYTEDYRFDALWKAPEGITQSGCPSIVEPNFSVYSMTPRALALQQIYKKRWLARYWQSIGIRVFVDMNVSGRYYQDNFLGVPRGWKAYATRADNEHPEELEREILLARYHAGSDEILFMCYSGGNAAEHICRYYGAIFVPDSRDVYNASQETPQLMLV